MNRIWLALISLTFLCYGTLCNADQYAPTDRPYVEYRYIDGSVIQSDQGGFFEFICTPPPNPWQYTAIVHIPNGYTGPTVCTMNFKFSYNTGNDIYKDIYTDPIVVSDNDSIIITLDASEVNTEIPCWPNNQTGYNLVDVNATFFDCNGNFIGWPNYSIQGFNINKKCCPTVIKLSRFVAYPGSNKVRLVWETESELNNAGFNLYRAESKDGDYIKINDKIIQAQGSPTEAASYEFIDTGVQNRKTYWYKLEDIDFNGTATMHNPVEATPRLIFGIF